MRLLLVLLCLSLAPHVHACTVVVGGKIEFDPGTRAFAGTVVAIQTDSTILAGDAGFRLENDLLFWSASAEEQEEMRREIPRAGFLLIRADSPYSHPRLYAVYSAGLGSMCERLYSTADFLEERYSVGDTLLVVGEHAEGFGEALEAEPVVTSVWNAVAQVNHPEPLLRLSPLPIETPKPSRQFDITWESEWPRRYVKRLKKAIKAERDHERLNQLHEGFRLLKNRLSYEYEHDLARLHHAASPDDRIALLLKIRGYTSLRYHLSDHVLGNCSFEALVHRHLPTRGQRWKLNALLLSYGLKRLPPKAECESYRNRRAELTPVPKTPPVMKAAPRRRPG